MDKKKKMHKVKLSCEGQTRRFTLYSSPLEIAEVKNFISAIYPSSSKYNLTYLDEDGDKVLIDTDEELREAFLVVQMAGNSVLKLSLEFQQQQQPPIPEPLPKRAPKKHHHHHHRDRTPKPSPCPSSPPIPSPCEVVHPAFCDGCNKKIRGIRYQCQDCFDFDFCQSCKGSTPHNPDHTFREIRSHCWPFTLPLRSFLVFLTILLLMPCSGNGIIFLALSPILCPLYFLARRKMTKSTFLLCLSLALEACFFSFPVWVVVACLSVFVYVKFHDISRFISIKRQEFREYRRRKREERKRSRKLQKEERERRRKEEQKREEERVKEEERREEERKREEEEEKRKEEEEEREKELKKERDRLEALSALVGMGFSLGDSNEALDAVGNNINAAVERMVRA